MKFSPNIISLLLIVNVIGCMQLNFQVFLMGNQATAKHLIVTIVYLAIWLLTIWKASASGSKTLVSISAMFWMLTLTFSLLTLLVNLTEADISWSIPFVILLLSPWYGVTYVNDSYVFATIVSACISLFITISAFAGLRYIKKVNINIPKN